MHQLLERQLRKATAADGTLDTERLVRDLDRVYQEADRERRIKEHAFTVMQREVEELNLRIRQEAEARFSVVMDNVGEAVIIIDENCIVESFNVAAIKIFGYQAEEVIGRNVKILMTEENAGHHDATVAHYLRTGQAKIIGTVRETIGRRKDGSVFPIELGVGEVSFGARRQFIGVIRDISMRKLAEEELRESEGRFRDLAGSASDWFWETDDQNRLTFVSDRIASVLGVKPSAVLGCTFLELGQFDAGTATAHGEELKARKPFRDRVFHVGPPEGYDSRIIRVSGLPTFRDTGDFVGYRGVGVDITREVAAERRAHEAQQLLTDAIERIIDGLAIYDANDRLVLCNEQYKQFFCRSDANFVFEDVLRANFAPFDTGGMEIEEWVRMRMEHHRAASGRPLVQQMVDGRWILLRDFRMIDGGTVCLRTDITEMKHHEQELESLRRLYRIILDSAGEGIVGVNTRGRIVFANRKAGNLLGYVPEKMIDRCFHGLVQPNFQDGEEYPAEQSPIGCAYRHGTMTEVSDDTFWTADGSVMPVDYYVAPIDEDGVTTGAVVVFRDATLRLRYERTLADSRRELERLVRERTLDLSHEVEIRTLTQNALQESRERLKSVTDSLFEGVLVINCNGDVSFANPSARTLLELEDDPEGQPIDNLVRLGGVEFTGSSLHGVVKDGGTIRDDDAAFVTASGKLLEVAYACSAIYSVGKVRGVVVSFRDITTLKRVQREGLQASRMASVGQLAAGIAHEINTPIQYLGDNLRFIADSMAQIGTAIEAGRRLTESAASAGLIGQAAEFSSICESGDIEYLLEEVPKAVSQSLEGVAHVTRIVLSMKEFSHPGTTSKSMADINRAIDNTLTVAHNTWKQVAEVVRDFDMTLPAVPCYVGELNQVFLNLVVNACHAIEAAGKDEPGLIRITTECDGDHVIICIADNGTGVPEAMREKIFDPFFTTKDVGKGTGQGLAICRDVVVVKHGGKIEVGGCYGKGATFTIRLPIDPVDPVDNDRQDSSQEVA